MNAALRLRVETRRGELARVADSVEAFARERNWQPALEFPVKLAVEEVLANVIEHAHADDARHEARIEIVSNEEAIVVEIVDDGRPFDPLTEAPAPDLDSPLPDRAAGGLGLHLVRSLMDELRYRREGGRNRLTLVKRRSG